MTGASLPEEIAQGLRAMGLLAPGTVPAGSARKAASSVLAATGPASARPRSASTAAAAGSLAGRRRPPSWGVFGCSGMTWVQSREGALGIQGHGNFSA